MDRRWRLRAHTLGNWSYALYLAFGRVKTSLNRFIWLILIDFSDFPGRTSLYITPDIPLWAAVMVCIWIIYIISVFRSALISEVAISIATSLFQFFPEVQFAGECRQIAPTFRGECRQRGGVGGRQPPHENAGGCGGAQPPRQLRKRA